MNERDIHHHQEQDISTVLAALGSSCPDDGLDQRVIQRIAAPDFRSPSRTDLLRAWLRDPRCSVGAGLASCALCVSLFCSHFTGRHLSTATRSAQSTSASQASTPDSFRSSTERAQPLGNPALTAGQGIQHNSGLRRVPSHGKRSEIAEATREASYPAPIAPLTEQERLLLRIAHRNDPVQVAMLDPVERNLQRTRERAEADRFFAPPALPLELRQQIHAALRSQYVNTPPPDDETLNQMTDRSTP